MRHIFFTLMTLALFFGMVSCCDAKKGEVSDNETTTETTMNTTMQDLMTRRSIRSYTDEIPSDEVIAEICEAGTYAPTGMNRQSPIIIAVTNREMRDKLSQMNAAVMNSEGDPFYGAPVVLVVLANREAAMTWKEDGSLVMGNLMNAAHAKGLGSCWIHRAREVFETPEGKAILADLGIEGDYVGIGNCILGYVNGDYPEARPRKDNYVYWIK